MILFCVFWLVSLPYITQSQPIKAYRRIDTLDFTEIVNEIKTEYKNIRKVPEKYDWQAYIALSYYPELKDANIKFVYSKIFTTMACRPGLDFIFRRRKNRVYRIYINKNPDKVEKVLLRQIPFNGQIGVIGHELAHVIDYSQKSSFGIIATGIGYLFPGYRIRLEHKIDNITIKHGLGWQLYDFSDYVLNYSDASKEYKKYKRRIYYSPKDILEIIEQNPIIYHHEK